MVEERLALDSEVGAGLDAADEDARTIARTVSLVDPPTKSWLCAM
jgi:hypothetical protein